MSYITLLLLVLCLSVHACKCNSRRIHFHHQAVEATAKLGAEKPKDLVVKEEAASATAISSGDHIIVASDQNDLQRLPKAEVLVLVSIHGSQARPRSLLGASSSRDDTDEALDSKENDIAEDTVVMDYAQPHRKPPIHNEKS